MSRIISSAFGAVTSVVRNYLEREPALSARLDAADLPIVIFDQPMEEMFGDPIDFFASIQRALTAAQSNGRGLYVVRTTASAVVGAMRLLPDGHAFPALHCERGVFVGYIAPGEGGIVFFSPSGDLRGSHPPAALFEDAISAMMATDR